LLQLPAVQRLLPAALARLMAACVEKQQFRELQLLHQHPPAAQQAALDAGTVRQLLMLAFETQQWAAFDWLMKLPAAPVEHDEVPMCQAVRALVVNSE
jgi:hypothetical protein